MRLAIVYCGDQPHSLRGVTPLRASRTSSLRTSPRYSHHRMQARAAFTMDEHQRGQLANLLAGRIAAGRKTSGSQRSSRANTPTANPFGQPQQQSMPAFQPPPQSNAGFGGGFNFTAGGDSNPFAQQQNQNGTPPPTAFQFGGAPSQPPAQQNGAGGMFGNNSTNFGSTFGSNNAQPQQNGFTPSTSSMFASQNKTANASSFKFGTETQSQQNGATPSTNASFPTFGTQTENPFKNFGQSQQTQSTPGTSFGVFNSQPKGEDSQLQTNGAKSLFNTDTPKTTTSSIFSSFGQQQKENKPPFGSTAPVQPTANANNGGLFSSQPQNGTPQPSFGSTPPPEQAEKPNGSVFLGLDSTRASTVKPGMFTSSNEAPQTPASDLFSFGQQGQQKDATSQAQETPKPSSMFSNLGQPQQTNGDKSTMFGANASTQQTPKPANSLFSFGQTQQRPNSTPGFKLGQGQPQVDDASMTTPGNTPQKGGLFGTLPSQAAPTPGMPASQGRSLFDRIDNGPPSTAQKPTFTPSTSLFDPQIGAATPAQQSQTTATPRGGLFDRITPDDATVSAVTQTAFAPSTSLFNKAPEVASNTPSAAPWLSHTPVAPQTTITPPTPQRQITGPTAGTQQPAPGSKQAKLKSLNEGLIRHLDKEDPINDWTAIMQYYLREAAKIEQQAKTGPSSTRTVQTPTVKTAQPLSATTQLPPTNSNMFGSAAPKPPVHAPNMFSAAATQQTPKTSSPFPSQPPASAPVNKKRPVPFEEDDGDEDERPAPATEKRLKTSEAINYPSLPENASTTARLFQATLDKSTGSATPPPTGFVPQSSSGSFKPAASGTAMPSFGAPASGSGSFLASFGKKANAEEEKQKKKRKAEDYDSDEETEEAWEKRDRAEQEVKRKKIEEAAKTGSGFDVSRSVTPVPPPETPAGKGKGLFDRVSKEAPATAPSKPSHLSRPPITDNATTSFFGSKTPAATSSSSLLPTAGSGDAAKPSRKESEDHTEHDTGDNTWKPHTPIKFGNATSATESTTPATLPPPRFGNLFGESKTAAIPGSNTGMLNIPSSKPSLGFNFGWPACVPQRLPRHNSRCHH